jgi:hypothetical protein
MVTVYLVCLVVAGGLALLSAFGDFLDFGVDGDAALDLDVDLDFDTDADFADVGDTQLETGSAPVASIFSLRALLFALFGFGAAGTLLTALGAAPGSPLTLALSVGAGLSVGLSVGVLLAYLKRSDTHSRPGDEGFRGLTGRVILPLGADSPGQVVVRRGQREHTVRALPHPAAHSEPAGWKRVMIVEMKSGIAYVGPLEDDEVELLP